MDSGTMFMSIGMENKDTMTREREREKPLCSRSTIHAADEPVRCMCCTMFLTYKRVCINSRSKYSRFDSSGYSILYGVQSYTLKRIIQCRCKKEDKWHQAPIGGFYQSSVIHWRQQQRLTGHRTTNIYKIYCTTAGNGNDGGSGGIDIHFHRNQSYLDMLMTGAKWCNHVCVLDRSYGTAGRRQCLNIFFLIVCDHSHMDIFLIKMKW